MKTRRKRSQLSVDEITEQLLNCITPEIQDEIDFKMSLAAKISAAIKAKGWTQNKFAAEIGVKQVSLISRWVSGTNNFEVDTLRRIEKVLGIRLIDLDDPNAKKPEYTIKAVTSANDPTYTSLQLDDEFPINESFQITTQDISLPELKFSSN